MKVIFEFIDYNKKDFFTLPVSPQEVTINYGKMIDTINILKLGEIDFHIGTKLTEISFSSFFPAKYDAGYCVYSNIPQPIKAKEKIEKWVAGKDPVRFLITHFGVNDVFNIVQFDYSIRGGTTGDIYYDIVLRRHRKIEIMKVGEKRAQVLPREDTKPTPIQKTYTVKEGDNLYNIAIKMYNGDGSKYLDIYEANKAKIGNNPSKISPGMVLILP